MERNALLAVVISLLILVVWNEFVVQQYLPQDDPGREIPAASPERDAAPAAPDAPAALPAAPLPPGAGPREREIAAQDTPSQLQGNDVVVETDLFRAVFTTAGARLKSLQLIGYQENTDPGSPLQDLVQASYGAPLPLGVQLRGKSGSANDSNVLYSVDRNHLSLQGNTTGGLSFTGQLDGATVTKRIDLTGDRYLWSLAVDVANPPDFASEIAITWDASLDEAGGWRAGVAPTANPYTSILALESDDLQTATRDDLTEGRSFPGSVDWIGFSGQYFFSGLIADGGETTSPAQLKAGL